VHSDFGGRELFHPIHDFTIVHVDVKEKWNPGRKQNQNKVVLNIYLAKSCGSHPGLKRRRKFIASILNAWRVVTEHLNEVCKYRLEVQGI
jgi:hypothetical protein